MSCDINVMRDKRTWHARCFIHGESLTLIEHTIGELISSSGNFVPEEDEDEETFGIVPSALPVPTPYADRRGGAVRGRPH